MSGHRDDPVTVTRYTIVPDRSTVWIEATSNVHPIETATSGLEGYVELPLGPSGTLDLAAAPTGRLSLAVDRLKSGNRLQDREMQKRIGAQKFPRIEGELQTVARNGSGESYQVSGDVTFRGVSRHHEDQMEIEEVDPARSGSPARRASTSATSGCNRLGC